MTDHADISRRLALAIGWPTHELDEYDWPTPGVLALDDGEWRLFDYREPAVIWPIAERFDCFPMLYRSTGTWAVSPGQWMAHEDTDTAALAVALAVIKAKESK